MSVAVKGLFGELVRTQSQTSSTVLPLQNLMGETHFSLKRTNAVRQFVGCVNIASPPILASTS